MTSASSITSAEFKDALSRYPSLIKKLSDAEKPAPVTLGELDRFRYIEAPAAFSKQTGRVMEAKDVQQLTAWKLRHGKWRPSLSKLVAANTDAKIAEATSEAFAFYASNPSDISGTLKLLAAPLKGVGPATASLLLSVHDPKNIIFFSDEAYRWLVAGGSKVSLKYDVKEYDILHAKTQALAKKLSTTPIDIEKVAFVIVKENEPVKEVKAPYVPSGLPRGRPAKPDSEKKLKVPSGRGRGRPKATGAAATKVKAPKAAKAAKQVKATETEEEEEATTPIAKKRGRPSVGAETSTPATGGKKRGRPTAGKAEDAPSAKKAKKT